MPEPFRLSPFVSDTHDAWLLLYIASQYPLLCCPPAGRLLMVCLVPRIQNAIHSLTHEPGSLTNALCHHRSAVGLLCSTLLAFSFESLFTADVVYQRRIHATHHAYSMVEGKDLSLGYTAAPYKSARACVQCFFQPEIEFCGSLQLAASLSPIMCAFGVRAAILVFLSAVGLTRPALELAVISRFTRMLFYLVSFHLQHVEPDGTLVAEGKNFRPHAFDWLHSLLFGRLGIEEGYGHRTHHAQPALKARAYNATPTHESPKRETWLGRLATRVCDRRR